MGLPMGMGSEVLMTVNSALRSAVASVLVDFSDGEDYAIFVPQSSRSINRTISLCRLVSGTSDIDCACLWFSLSGRRLELALVMGSDFEGMLYSGPELPLPLLYDLGPDIREFVIAEFCNTKFCVKTDLDA